MCLQVRLLLRKVKSRQEASAGPSSSGAPHAHQNGFAAGANGPGVRQRPTAAQEAAARDASATPEQRQLVGSLTMSPLSGILVDLQAVGLKWQYHTPTGSRVPMGCHSLKSFAENLEDLGLQSTTWQYCSRADQTQPELTLHPGP